PARDPPRRRAPRGRARQDRALDHPRRRTALPGAHPGDRRAQMARARHAHHRARARAGLGDPRGGAMALTIPPRAGQIAYGALFAAVLPALLVVWAKRTSDVVRLPAVTSMQLGVALILVGATLVIGGW